MIFKSWVYQMGVWEVELSLLSCMNCVFLIFFFGIDIVIGVVRKIGYLFLTIINFFV